MKGDQLLRLCLPASWALRPSERAHHLLPACLLSSILHYPTDDLSDRRPPPADSRCQPSVRIKPAALFIFILPPFPSSVFFFFLKIVCQHHLLSGAQWNKQCLLNWQFWLFAACDFSKAWQPLARRHGKPFQIRKSVKRKPFQETEVVTAAAEQNKSLMY